jgi:hypothetical protein
LKPQASEILGLRSNFYDSKLTEFAAKNLSLFRNKIMPKVRPILQHFFILFFASLLFGCVTPPPKFDVAALKPYQKLMLVSVKTDEMLFVT